MSEPACLNPERLIRCGCEWREERLVTRLSTLWRHGDNPEAVAEFAERTLRTGELCTRGHFVPVEQWMARVVAYEHGDRDE